MNIGFGVQDMPLSCLLFMSFMLNVCPTVLMYSSSNYLHIVAFIFLFFQQPDGRKGVPVYPTKCKPWILCTAGTVQYVLQFPRLSGGVPASGPTFVLPAI